ncbi:hypothetical protein [Ectobacillus panaciterrae]|nr:hypothetical protein [Ectobacillus panaciterrae]
MSIYQEYIKTTVMKKRVKKCTTADPKLPLVIELAEIHRQACEGV